MKLDPTNLDHYEILTAMRGPDNQHLKHHIAAKMITTSVIRHFAGCTTGGTILPPESAKTPSIAFPHDQAVEFLNHPHNEHFRIHMWDAFYSLHRVRFKSKKGYKEIESYIDWLKSLGIKHY